MRRLVKSSLILLVGVLLLLVAPGCAVPATHALLASQTVSRAGATDTIVGRWEAIRKCDDVVRALNEQGLGALAPSVVGDYFPNATYEELAAKDDVCSGAKPQIHYHFFTADGFFGSLDQHENQVDDGTYTIVDSNTIRIGDDAVFDFRIQGATLQLTPRITEAQRQYALAHPTEFTTAAWMVAVAVQGIKWKHVPCQGWC
jgi:hypothetical protein